MSTEEALKKQVRDYWNSQPCGTQFSASAKYSRAYFDEIESFRYKIEPEIFSFAQFSRFHGQKILEVGVGAGTDFLQWVRSGTYAYGIDATQEGVTHVKERLAAYNLHAEDVRVADCEALPFEDGTFDLVYSWGVIHHTADTTKAMQELIRVCKPGGICKVMVYHRHSLLAYFFWLKYAFLKGRPWKSLAWCLFYHMESTGTKAYTRSEIVKMLYGQAVESVIIKPRLTFYDRLGRFGPVAQAIAKGAAWILGQDRVGWFLTVEFSKMIE